MSDDQRSYYKSAILFLLDLVYKMIYLLVQGVIFGRLCSFYYFINRLTYSLAFIFYFVKNRVVYI